MQGLADPATQRHAAYRKFGGAAWAVLGYNILVVLWGAFVRATGSGAGCGSHWPLCNGEVVPRAARVETIIEFVHRITSGISLVGVIGLYAWAWRLFPKGHRIRRSAALAVVFLFTEALLGAGLVLFQYVEHNASAGRAAYLSAHLVNTQILLAMLTMTAWFAGRTTVSTWRMPPGIIRAALPTALLVSVTGALAALGDTLFPASSLASGFQQEFSTSASALLRLRVLHPAVAVLAAIALVAAALMAMRTRPAARTAVAVAILVFAQLAAGALNMVLLAPVWMQIVHLLIADLLWIALVVMTLEFGFPITETQAL